MLDETGKKYTCAAGETWCGVAFRVWQREGLAHHLIAANPLLAARVVFNGGEVLRVPEKPKDESDRVALPPWR